MRATFAYTTARILLFAAATGLFYLAGARGLLLLGLALLVSGAASCGLHAGPCLGIEALAITRLAHLHRRGDMDQQEVANLADHAAHPGARLRVRRDRRAGGDPPVPGHLRGHETDPGDVQVAVGTGEREARREQLPHQIPVEKRHRAVAALAQGITQSPGD